MIKMKQKILNKLANVRNSNAPDRKLNPDCTELKKIIFAAATTSEKMKKYKLEKNYKL